MPLRFRFFRKELPIRERLLVGGGSEHYAIEVRRHPAARRYTLRVREARRDVVLTMPPRGSMRQAKRFAEKNVDWIAARLRRLPRPAPFAPDETVPLRGVPHRIVHRPGARGTAWTETDADGTPLLCVAGGAAHIGRRARDFLKAEARRDLVAASRRYAAILGVSIRVGFVARHGEPLGFVLAERIAVVFLATGAGAALRARLSRRPRGHASRRA